MDDLGKTIGHLFYARSSFVHHVVAIGEFKLELRYEYAQFRSKLAILLSSDLEILKPIGHLSKATSSFMQHFIAMWIKTGVNSLETAKLGFDLWDLDLRPFAWTSLWSMVNHSWNFMIWWQEQSKAYHVINITRARYIATKFCSGWMSGSPFNVHKQIFVNQCHPVHFPSVSLSQITTRFGGVLGWGRPLLVNGGSRVGSVLTCRAEHNVVSIDR